MKDISSSRPKLLAASLMRRTVEKSNEAVRTDRHAEKIGLGKR